MKSAGRIKGRSELEPELTQLTVNGKTYWVETSSYTRTGGSRSRLASLSVPPDNRLAEKECRADIRLDSLGV